jgi:hypothetical protein
LFRWAQSETQKVINCPWPFLRYARGPVDRLQAWPLWGTKTISLLDGKEGEDKRRLMTTSFFLWPLGGSQVIERKDMLVKRWQFLPFLYSEREMDKRGTRNSERGEQDAQAVESDKDVEAMGPVSSRYFKLWPLMVYRREGDVARFRILALWPGKHLANVERNYSRLWSLYSSVRIGHAREDELLWRLFYHRRDHDGTRTVSLFPLFRWRKAPRAGGDLEWKFLLGLVGYKREGLQKTLRLLYFFPIHMGSGEDE